MWVCVTLCGLNFERIGEELKLLSVVRIAIFFGQLRND